MFDHYVLMRFNFGLYKNNKLNHDEWMRHRMLLFDEYTMPSIQRQTVKNFKLVLSFDEETPNDIILKYDYLDNVIIIYEHLMYWMRANVDRGKWLITTRMDNDDYIERDFIESIQNEFNEKIMVVDLKGRVYDSINGVYYESNRVIANSMFLSLIEPGEICMTCYDLQHTHMPAKYDSILLDKYGSIMVVHDRNIMNSVLPRHTKCIEELQSRYVNG